MGRKKDTKLDGKEKEEIRHIKKELNASKCDQNMYEILKELIKSLYM